MLFQLQEAASLGLDISARSGTRTRGAVVREMAGMEPKRLKLRLEHDNMLRGHCE